MNRTGNTTGTNSVDWGVTGSGTNPANAADFGGTLPTGTVSFAAGETSKTITVNVSGDTLVETDDTFTVTLSNPSNGATITTAAATGTIQNDDTSSPADVSYNWAQKAGGNGNDSGRSISVDSSGNIYTTGEFFGTATFGSTSLTSAGSADIFITKHNSNGTLAWSRKMGGGSEDYSRSIRADSSGNIYTTGEFFGTATFGSTSLTSTGGSDIFITKHNSDGTLAWSRKMGGSSNDSGRSIAVDSSGNIYTIGFFAGTATFGNITLTSGGFRDIFITKHNSDGTFAWAQKMGGSSDDSGRSIAVDSSGNIYTTGIFEGTATFGSTSLTSAGSADIFITKHNSDGTFAWARKMGGSSWDYGAGIGVDGSGNIYTTGEFSGTATFGSTSLTSAGGTDIFITKHNSDGTFAWAQKMGGSSNDSGRSTRVNSNGDIYTTGAFLGTATFGSTSLTSTGGNDIFITKHNSDGTLAWAEKMGGNADDYGNDIVLGSSGKLHTTGSFSGTADFDPGDTTANLTSAGGSDIFTAVFGLAT